jgi:Na+-transporting methylmalonyl-CoA/oxaloacetate decarboxylase gamma subunit
VAEANTTIDPDDLDSIDALLDEAEFDLEDEKEQNFPNLDEADLQQKDDFDIDISDEQESTDDLNSMLGLDDEPASLADAAPAMAPAPAKQSFNDNQTDDFISRRSKASQTTDELTVEEMDAIKKMIIGFGVGLVILLIVAIVFAAMAAFSASSDPELNQKITEIKEETEISRIAVQSNEKSLRDLNRKVDALSFQVEQLTADMISANNTQAGQLVERGGIPSAPQISPQTTPQAPNTQVVTQLSQGLEDKVDSITRSLALAQRRIVEVNNRVTSLQQQQGTVLKSVKDIEKSLLEKQLTVTQSEEQNLEQATAEQPENQKAKPATSYRYQAPTGLMYQPSGSGVYP